MKNKLPLLALVSLLSISLGSCGQTSSVNPSSSTSSSAGSSNPASSTSSIKSVVVTGVTITGADDNTTVLDGSTVTLKATVNSTTTGLKVTWSSSSETVAKVVNGVVTFKTVSADTPVSITATSKDDTTKSATLHFTVKHSIIDLQNSRGNSLDSSLLISDDTISADVGDTAMVFADVHSTKWYVQADISLDAFSESDSYPKFGIMTGTNAGYWNATTDTQTDKNAFFYVDAVSSTKNSGWTNFNFVPQNDTHTDWNWGGQLGAFTVSNDDKVVQSTDFTMGLLRDGVDYYLYMFKTNAENKQVVSCYKHLTYSDIAADDASYVWLGGWSTGVTCKNFIAKTGDAVDSIFTNPTTLTVTNEAPTIYINSEYQLNVSADVIDFNRGSLTYASSDTTIATVDTNGLVKATSKTGTTNITITLGSLTKTVALTVSDDTALNVTLDGKMDDVLWSDSVKTNFYVLKNNDTNYINFYAAKNDLGVYLFADYHVSSVKSSENKDNWWEQDNFECRFGTETEPAKDTQYWASATKNFGTFTDGFISDETQNANTSLYDMTFEMFVSYDDLGLTKNDVVTWRVGFNPAAGWKSCAWWESSTLADFLVVTRTGFASNYPTSNQCTTAHTYGDYVVSKAATCAEDGEKYHVCKYCGHKETVTIPKGEHTYDIADAKVVTPSTCSTHGSGTVECTTCHQTVTVELPMDAHNHSAWDDAKGYCTACGGCLKEDLDGTSTAWDSSIGKFGLDGSKSWEFKTTFTNTKTATDTDWSHNWVSEVFSPNWANGGWSFRSDWWGWGAWNVTGNAASCGNKDYSAWGDDAAYTSGIVNTTVVLDYKFDATTGIIKVHGDTVSHVDGITGTATIDYASQSFTYRGDMVVGLGVNISTIKITNAQLISGSYTSTPHITA